MKIYILSLNEWHSFFQLSKPDMYRELTSLCLSILQVQGTISSCVFSLFNMTCNPALLFTSTATVIVKNFTSTSIAVIVTIQTLLFTLSEMKNQHFLFLIFNLLQKFCRKKMNHWKIEMKKKPMQNVSLIF